MRWEILLQCPEGGGGGNSRWGAGVSLSPKDYTQPAGLGQAILRGWPRFRQSWHQQWERQPSLGRILGQPASLGATLGITAKGWL